MYLYKISILKQSRLGNGNIKDLISKMLHNWRTHYKNNIEYKATLSKLIIICLYVNGTYMLSSVSELNEMLKYYTHSLTFSETIPELITKTGYTSLSEITKLSKLLKITKEIVFYLIKKYLL